jgi:hypothetical protein
MMKNEIIKSYLFYLIRTLLINHHLLPRNLPLRLAAVYSKTIWLSQLSEFAGDTSGQLPAPIALVT